MAERPEGPRSAPAAYGAGASTGITAIYQGVVMDHGRAPRRRGTLAHPTHSAACRNRLCGDDVALSLLVVDGVVADVAFEGKGCAVMLAAASTLCETVVEQPLAAVDQLRRAFCGMVTGSDVDAQLPEPLSAFAALSPHPSRHRCATLAWEALASALE